MTGWLLVGLLAVQGAMPLAVSAQATTADAATPARAAGEDAFVRVAQQLRCPVCQQLSILDSPAELAVEMRAVVRERLAAGDSEEDVLAYFVSKYGEWVLLNPPKRGFNLVVWLAPLLVLIGGAAVLAKTFSAWLRSGETDTGSGMKGAVS